MAHKVYKSIVYSVKAGFLIEPFGEKEFREACPSFGEGTYKAFLHKHRVGNPGGNSELFELISPGRFRCVRPFLYNL